MLHLNGSYEKFEEKDKILYNKTPPVELKNCTEPFDNACIIEAYYDRGQHLLFQYFMFKMTLKQIVYVNNYARE